MMSNIIDSLVHVLFLIKKPHKDLTRKDFVTYLPWYVSSILSPNPRLLIEEPDQKSFDENVARRN